MGSIQLILNGAFSLMMYGVIVYAVYRIFRMSSELAEVKELLQEIKRNTQDLAPGPVMHGNSPEDLMRAVRAASYSPELESDPAGSRPHGTGFSDPAD
jgi:hypothetical protein